MFKIKPKIINSIIIPVVEIHCPICGDDARVEPTSNEKDTWECCECGMEFEVLNE